MLKVISSLKLFYKRRLRNGTKAYLEQKISLFIVKFKKLGFSAPLKTLIFRFICFVILPSPTVSVHLIEK